MNFTITAYSTALFSTWIFIEELGLLFDCGDGISSALLQKARKIKHVFLSHADRDHISGFFQFNQLNGREGFPKVYFPESSGSFAAMQNFCEKFDPHAKGATWQGLKDGDSVALTNNIYVKAIKNNHLKCASDAVKSFSFQVIEKRKKLKVEFQNYTQEQIIQQKERNGKESITYDEEIKLICYSGDNMVEDYSIYDGSKIVIHEATFLAWDETIKDKAKAYKHSCIEDVMRMVSKINIEILILTHFSTRYSAAEIDEAIHYYREKYKIKIPVYKVMPGRINRDILAKNIV